MRHWYRRCRYCHGYRRNPDTSKELESKLKELEVEAARWFVSLATYVRVAAYLQQHLPYDLPDALNKKLLGIEHQLDAFEETGVIPPELGYAVFSYLESHKNKDVIDAVFISQFDDPPKNGKDFEYWKPRGALRAKDIAYIPWTAPIHAQLLQSYQLPEKVKQVIGYHINGGITPEGDALRGLASLLIDINELERQYHVSLQGSEPRWIKHRHTQSLELAIDLLNEFLAGGVEPLDLVWLEEKFKPKPKPKPRTRKKTSKKKKTKKKTTRKKKATKKKATKKKTTKKKAAKKKAIKKRTTKKKTPRKRRSYY